MLVCTLWTLHCNLKLAPGDLRNTSVQTGGMHAHAQWCRAPVHPVDCRRQVKRQGDFPKRLVSGGGKMVRSPHASGRILSLYSGFNGVQSGTKSSNTWRSQQGLTLKAPSMKWLGLWERRGFPGGSGAKNPPANAGDPGDVVWPLGMEEGMEIHSSVLAWRSPWSLAGCNPCGHEESDTSEWPAHTQNILTGLPRWC